jgi:hypothetical protein
MMPTCFSEFAPYSLSIEYCHVKNVFSRNILLVPLSVCKGKKVLPLFPAFALNLTVPFLSTIFCLDLSFIFYSLVLSCS